MNNEVVLKTASSAIAAGLLDKYLLKQPDMKKTVYFGAAVGAGIGVATAVSPLMPQVIPSLGDGLVDGKTLSHRVLEVGLGAGGAFALNKYVLSNEIPREQFLPRLGVIVLSDFAGEYVKDYMMGEALSYFS